MILSPCGDMKPLAQGQEAWHSLAMEMSLELVDVAALCAEIRENPALLEERLCLEELRYCQGKARESEHLAARLAAKKALFAALGGSRKNSPDAPHRV